MSRHDPDVPAPLLSRGGKSGLEILRLIVAGEIPAMPMEGLLDFRVVEAREGFVAVEAHPRRAFYNHIGVVHGGWPGVLLDNAMAFSVMSRLPAGVGHTTVEYKVNTVRPITEASGPLRAEGRAVHVGTRTATAEGRLVDAQGKVYAHGSETCLVFPMKDG